MIAYIIRRVLYAFPVLIGVNIITFLLFFYVNTPEMIARRHAGKRPTPESIEKWVREHNMDLPYLYNVGWKKLRAFSAKGPFGTETKANLPTAGKGHYRIVVKVPESKEENGPRTIQIRSVIPAPPPPPPPEGQPPPKEKPPEPADTPAGKVTLPSEFGADGKLALDATTRATEYEFDFDPESAKNAVIQILFTVNAKPTVAPPAPPDVKPDPAAKPKPPPMISNMHRISLEYLDPHQPAADKITQTLFWQHSFRTLFFEYGKDADGKPIWEEFLHRAGPSMSITVPTFFLSLFFTIFFGMIIAFHRGTYVDRTAMIICIILMSIAAMFYITGFQALLSKVLMLAPISGFEYGSSAVAFVWLPICIAVFMGIPGGVRFYRIIFLEEVNKDHIRTARAKGMSEGRVMFVHALKNAMLPILTNVIVELPTLYVGSLLLESFFAIPGMGSFMINGIQAQDFAVVQACVCLGSFIYVCSLIFTDICYTIVDPRVRLQ